MSWTTFLIATALTVGGSGDVHLDRAIPTLLTGRAFQNEMQRPMTASWSHSPLRTLLQSVTEVRQVAILLDRSIDPTQEISLDVADIPLAEVLQVIATQSSAELSIVGSVAYIGPPNRAAKLRTLVRLRADELFNLEHPLTNARRRFELTRRRTFHWNDLDEPVRLLASIAERYQLPIDGLEAIHHDLWAGATLPAINANEALALLLIQFDRTFEWGADAERVTVINIPNDVSLVVEYALPGMNVDKALAACRQKFPQLALTVRNKNLVVRGTVEQQEAVDAFLNPARSRPTAPRRDSAPPTPLARRRFTLRIENVPALALMKKLESTGVRFEYDPAALKAANIDLTQMISIDIQQATPEEFFAAVFAPLKVSFVIDGISVHIKPQ